MYRELTYVFLYTGIEHSFGFSPCSPESVRFFSLIFHWGAGGDTDLLLSYVAIFISCGCYSYRFYVLFSGCSCCSLHEYLHCRFKSIVWHWYRQGRFAILLVTLHCIGENSTCHSTRKVILAVFYLEIQRWICLFFFLMAYIILRWYTQKSLTYNICWIL